VGHFLFQVITYLLALFFVILGLLCLIIPWSESMRHILITFLESNWITLFLFGVGFFTIGLVIMINLASSRRRHYSVRTGPLAISVDTTLVEAYLKEYFGSRYPNRDVACRVSVKKNCLQISADLPNVPSSIQRDLLKEIEQELQELLANSLGYCRSMRLFISFGE